MSASPSKNFAICILQGSKNYKIWYEQIWTYGSELGVNIETVEALDTKINASIRNAILASVCPSLQPTVMDERDALKCLANLKNACGVVTGNQRMVKLVELLMVKKKYSETYQQFVGRLRKIFSDVNSIKKEDVGAEFPEDLLRGLIIVGLPDWLRSRCLTWTDLNLISIDQFASRLMIETNFSGERNVNAAKTKRKRDKRFNKSNQTESSNCNHAKKIDIDGKKSLSGKKVHFKSAGSAFLVKKPDPVHEAFLVDSGCSQHCTSNLNVISEPETFDGVSLGICG